MNTNLLKILAELEKNFTVADVLVSIYNLLDTTDDKDTKAYLNELCGLMTQTFAHDNAYPVNTQDFRSLRAGTRRGTPNKEVTGVKRLSFTAEKLEEFRKDCYHKQMALMEEFSRKRAAQIKRARAKAESLKM